MPFQKTQEGQEADPKIYRGGRSHMSTKVGGKEVGKKALLDLFRKVKPHSTKAVNVAVEIMGNTEFAASTRLQAAMMLLKMYAELPPKIYDAEEAGGIDEDTPVFRLKVVGGKDAKEKVSNG